MSLFKTGDATHDQFATYTTEQLIEIVNDGDSYLPGEVETARKVLLARGLDYRTSEQKQAEKELQRINALRDTAARDFATPRVRINRTNQSDSGTGLKTWHWIWIIVILIRLIGCLIQNR
jgi:hypothetical protein